MTLKKKIPGILLVLMTMAAVSNFAVHRWVIYPNYAAMEQAQAKKDLIRCVTALKDEIAHLDAFTNDWAAWNDTCRFVAERTADYIDSNLGPHTFLDNALNLIAFYDLQGRLVWSGTYDLTTGRPVRIQPFDRPALPATHPLLLRAGTENPIRGLFASDQGPMLVASRPIITSDRKGPPRGSLIMGRLLSPALAGDLVQKTQVDHRIWSLNDTMLPREEREAAGNMKGQSDFSVYEKDRRLQVYTTVPDISGVPLLLIRADVSREISAKGIAAIKYAVLSDTLVSIAILAALVSLLQFAVIRPVSQLTRYAGAMRSGATLPPQWVCSHRRDEIGTLFREFESMVTRLQSAHQGLQLEIDERRRSQEMLGTYHSKLRRLSSELLLAEEKERRRIAIELHDRIGQSLAVSKMRLDALAAGRPDGDEVSKIMEISRLLGGTIADTRTLTFELSPPILYEFGLASALEWLSEKFGREHDLAVSFRSEGETPPPVDLQSSIMVFQAARELLFNIVKHAQAAEARIRMMTEGPTLRVEIQDDGRGFAAASENPGMARDMGFGLFSIRERLGNLGGRLEIDSQPGRGTRATLICPLKRTGDTFSRE